MAGRKTLVPLACLSLAACASVPAGPPDAAAPVLGEPFFRPHADALILADLDANGDARVTGEEAYAGALALAARFDQNSDGGLGALELQALGIEVGGAADAAPLLALADRNGDGAAAPAELAAYFESRVRRLDRNGDAALARDELIERIVPRAPRERDQPNRVRPPSPVQSE